MTTDLRTQMATHINAALALLDDIPDPVEREAAARLLGDDLLPATVLRVKAVRGDAIRNLRGQGKTLREIAGLTGLSVPRVDQIAKGVSRAAKK
ncbi:hypothetical protein ACWF94_37465 [Streptomyces sp. NPDC055078]